MTDRTTRGATSGAVAGKSLPVRVKPTVPPSLSIIVDSCETLTPLGTGSSPIRKAPAIPLGTCFTASWCEWYMPTAGVDCAVNV